MLMIKHIPSVRRPKIAVNFRSSLTTTETFRIVPVRIVIWLTVPDFPNSVMCEREG